MGLHVERHGKGKKILFIHGAGGTSASWYFQKEYLKSSAEVILVDLPGHGKSAGNGCQTVEGYVESVRDTLLEAAPEGSHLAGHSMGGAIAMSLALAYPDLVKGLVLVGTGARLRTLPEILEGVLKDKEKTVRNVVKFAFSKKASPRLVETGFNQMMQSEKEVIYGDFYACDRFNAMGRLGEIDIPTLVLCGADDLLTPPKYSQYLNKEILGSELVLVEDAGHMVMLEKPEETNRAIGSFLTRL